MSSQTDFEYKDFEWKPKQTDWVRKGVSSTSNPEAMTEAQARQHFWTKYQKQILVDLQEWRDAG